MREHDASATTAAGDSPPRGGAQEPPTPVVPHERLVRLSLGSRGAARDDQKDDPFPHRSRDSYVGVVEFARGGIGRIARAFDPRLSRVVALKELQSSSHMDEQRFAREVRVTARLQHPGIVPIYDAGRWPNGEPFYAMKLIAGESLSARIKRSATLAHRLEFLRCVENVADTMAYAHAQGVIHRDLKPSNVLVGEFGETVVIDWGLAKILQANEPMSTNDLADKASESRIVSPLDLQLLGGGAHHDSDEHISSGPDQVVLTQVGDVLGTPYFMSPEQALGLSVDTATDIWAVGAILYNVIAGFPPFSDILDGTPIERVARGEPTPLVEIAPDCPVELLDIVSRAMSIQPSSRYRSVREIADDLRRFQAGQFVSAHRYSVAERVGRRLRRRALPVAVTAVAALLLGVIGIVAAVRVGRERDRAEARRIEAVNAGAEAVRSHQAAVHKQDELLLLQARTQLDTDPTASIAALKSLSADWTSWTRARDVALEAHLRGVATLMPGHTGDVWAIETSKDGSIAITASIDRTLRIWDIAQGSSRVLATTESAQVAIAFPAESRVVYTAGLDRKIHRWSIDDSAPERVMGEHEEIVVALAVSPDGKTLASGSADGWVYLWDIRGDVPTRRARIRDQKGTVYALAFTPDGRSIVTGGADGIVRLRDLDTMKAREAPAHQGHVFSLAVSSRGEIATGGEDGNVQIFSSTTLDRRTLATGRGVVFALAFSRDGTRVASGSDDRRVMVHDLGTSARQVLRGHEAVHAVSFLPSGDLITCGADWTLRRWNPMRDGAEFSFPSPAKALSPVLSDGSIVVGLTHGTALRVDLARGVLREVARGDSPVTAIDATPNASLIAIGRQNGHVSLVGEQGEVADLPASTGVVNSVAISPDLSQIAILDQGRVRVFTRGSRQQHEIVVSESPLYDVVWWDDRTLFTSGWDHRVKRIDVPTGALVEIGTHNDWATALSLSKDRLLLASSGADHAIHLWPIDPITAARDDVPEHTLQGHTSRVDAVAVVDEGRVVLSASKDRTVRRWRVDTHDNFATRTLASSLQRMRADAEGKLMYAIAGETLFHWRESLPWDESLRAWLNVETNAILDDRGALRSADR